MSSSDRLCECIKLNRNRLNISLNLRASSSRHFTATSSSQRKTRIPRDVAFFPRLANRWSIKRRRGQRRKRGFRPLLHSPLMRPVGALAEARRHHSSQTQTVVEAAKNRDGCISVYIGPPNASERTKRICLPTQNTM